MKERLPSIFLLNNWSIERSITTAMLLSSLSGAHKHICHAAEGLFLTRATRHTSRENIKQLSRKKTKGNVALRGGNSPNDRARSKKTNNTLHTSVRRPSVFSFCSSPTINAKRESTHSFIAGPVTRSCLFLSCFRYFRKPNSTRTHKRTERFQQNLGKSRWPGRLLLLADLGCRDPLCATSLCQGVPSLEGGQLYARSNPTARSAFSQHVQLQKETQAENM